MAIGGDFSGGSDFGGGRNALQDRNFYSRFKLRSERSNKSLTINYKGQNMIIIINDPNTREDLETIYISPTKAYMLDKEISAFREYFAAGNIDPNKGFGVNAGFGEKISYIAFSADEDKNIWITIGKINGESGEIISSTTIALNTSYNYALRFNDVKKMDIEKYYYDELELDRLQNTFRDFSRAMTGAYAHSVMDLGRYELNRVFTRFDTIFDKLGIDRRSEGGNYNTFKESSFLSNAKAANVSYDSIEAAFEED